MYTTPDDPTALFVHPHNVPNMARMTERTTVKATLGRMPLPKRSAYERPPVHSGMTMKSRRTGVHYQAIGGDEMSRFDANGPSPLSGAPRGKRVAPVAVNPGCRDRSQDALASEEAGTAHARAKAAGHEAMHALGRAILNEAANHSAPDDRRALGIGTLPEATSKET